MSAIRPPVPSPLFPVQTPPPSPARASRSDFFRAALDGPRALAATSAPEADTPVRAVAPSVVGETNELHARPGALLDIRV